jgi:hypothetical protein
VIDKDTVEKLLIAIGNSLLNPTTLCVIGSTPSILFGQPERQTPDIDIWFPRSDFDVGDLKRACEQAGLVYDPKDEIDPDAVYLQMVRPGFVALPANFEVEIIGRYGNLRLVMPPPDLIVASKLARGSDSDIEDAVWWVRGRDLSDEQIALTIDQLPTAASRNAARENFVLVQLVSGGHGDG